MAEQHVVGPVDRAVGPVGQIERAQFRGLLDPVLVGFHRAGAHQRPADEAQPNRFELARRQHRRRIAGPEAVAVARDDREAGDLLVADEVVDFPALVIGAAVIAAAALREAVRGPRLLDQFRREVFQVGALSSVPCELPQIFQVAVEARRRSLNHCFCTLPRMRARRLVLARVGDRHVAELQFGGRLSAIGRAARVERDHRRFGEHPAEFRVVDVADAFHFGRVRAAEAVLVGEDAGRGGPAVAQRTIGDQAVDRGEVVRLVAQPVIVPVVSISTFSTCGGSNRSSRAPSAP